MKILVEILCVATVVLLSSQGTTGNQIVANLVSKLGLGQEYVTEPCRLMPFVELSPLLTMAELTITDQSVLKRAQNVYYEIGLNGMLYAGCLMTRNMGEDQARKVLQQWVSGYQNKQRQQIVLQDFEKAISDGKSAVTDKACITASNNRLKNAQVSKNPDGIITDELKQQQTIMQGRTFTPAELKVATETVAFVCLTTTPGLTDPNRVKLINVLKAAARFFHHIEGGVLRTIVGDQSQSQVLSLLLQGIMKANYLQLDEKMDRLKLMLSGDTVAMKSCRNKVVEDCVTAIESTD